MSGSINISRIREIVKQSGVINREAARLANNIFNEAKEEMLERFDTSPVTIEIKGGEDADNTTNTLINYNSKVGQNGNLFSFLGFVKGTDPTEDLRDFLEENTYLNAYPVQGNGLGLRFIGKVPTPDDIAEATPVPWGGGRSWVNIIEKGHGGFNYYLYKLHEVNTRSTRGVQAKALVREGDFKTIPYTTEIINEFIISVGTTKPF